MNRKQFILLLLFLAIIGSAGLVLLKSNKHSWTERDIRVGEKLLPRFRYNDVAAIHLQGEVEVNVVRTNATWRVRERRDYPANLQQIRDLLMKTRDLKVMQSESIGPSQLARVDLEDPIRAARVMASRATTRRPEGMESGSSAETAPAGCGILLEFKDDRGAILDTLLVGKMHQRHQNESEPMGIHGFFDGRYVLLPNDPDHVLLISDELASVSERPEAWLSREFIKVDGAKSISLSSTNGASLWTLTRESDSALWALSDSRAAAGEELDANAVSQIVELLRFLSFLDVAADARAGAASANSDKPMILLIETFDHFFYTLKIGAKRADGNYPLTFSVNADIPGERGSGKDDKLDDARKADDDFQDKMKLLRDKLARESELARAGWVYIMDSHLIEPLLRTRDQLLQKK
ncbi:MAG: hypothetical protein C5B50_09050 [Verrucomicrobia bacterium]|nr:MAG: hypothetical protein C5B50_09050 [Verrucomicrobiota bacterium]